MTQTNARFLDHQARLDAGRACLDAALQVYLPLGFSIVCCCDPDHIAVGKTHAKACTFPGKAPMHRWKQLQVQPPTPADVHAYWRDYPVGNVGVVLGQVSGLVRIDIDGADTSMLDTWSQGDLPPTWEFRSSGIGRGLLYRWPTDRPCKTTVADVKGKRHAEVRLMANGSQTILPPSRHASGSLYTWMPGHSPDVLGLAEAPAWLLQRLYDDGRRAPVLRDPNVPLFPMDRAMIMSTVESIPNTGVGVEYNDWIQVGIALHSTGADWAQALWDTWSQQSDTYNETRQATAWASFTLGGKAGLGTLFHIAKRYGYLPPWRLRPAVPDMTQSWQIMARPWTGTIPTVTGAEVPLWY
jgi:hypothetical protein